MLKIMVGIGTVSPEYIDKISSYASLSFRIYCIVRVHVVDIQQHILVLYQVQVQVIDI
jgi:hypothetical protein